MPSGLISEVAMVAGTKVFLLILFQMRLASIGCRRLFMQFQLLLANPSLCIPSSCGVAPATVLTLTQWFRFLALVIMWTSFHQGFPSITELPALVTNPDLSNT